ncbi:hypothetical protein JCM8547_003266 [Rhodosporidiobolus lusitaniae]
MPADRTASEEPTSTLKRKTGPSLGRGRACLTCRKRKNKYVAELSFPLCAVIADLHFAVRRCDGRLPFCTPCEAAAKRVGQDPSTIQCDYDTPEERRKPVGGGKVAALEAKIAALEKQVADMTAERDAGYPTPAATQPAHHASPYSASVQSAEGYAPGSSAPPADYLSSFPAAGPSDPSTSYHLAPPGSSAGYPHHPVQPLPPIHGLYAPEPGFASLPPQDPFAQRSASPYVPEASTSSYRFPQDAGMGFPAPPFSQQQPPMPPPGYPFAPSGEPHGMNGSPHFPDPSLGSSNFPTPSADHTPVFSPYPSQPLSSGSARLPSWPTLSRLLNAFLDFPHELADLINRKRFLDRFALPPDHPDFPAHCLLHAMVVTASDLLGEDAAFDGEVQYWPVGQSPTFYHHAQGSDLLLSSARTAKRLLDVAQASILFCAHSIAHTRFSRAFYEGAISLRLCVSLGLNHIAPRQDKLPFTSLLAAKTALGPPADWDELYERMAVMWLAFIVETVAMAATGWAGCLDERDITTLVPSAEPYTNNPAAFESLYLHSPTFFLSNPPDLVRVTQTNVKAFVLLHRVVNLVQRSTAFSNAKPDRPPPAAERFEKIRNSPAVKTLDSALDNFQSRTSGLVALLEPQAFLLPATIGAAVILLHENITTGEDGCPSMKRCIEAAEAVLGNMKVLNGASFHPRHLPPILSVCYMICARVFVRQVALEQRRTQPDPIEITRLRENVQMIVERLTATRTPLGPKYARSLAVLLDNAELALPQPDSPSPGQPTPFSMLMDKFEVALGRAAVADDY